MADFDLDPRLAANPQVIDWPLCRIVLENDARFPWLVLVPRRNGIREVFELSDADLAQFYAEVTSAAERVSAALAPTKMNVAMLGNMVPQLHAHVIARSTGDAAWPGPVWGVGERVPYTDKEAEAEVAAMRARLGDTP